MYGKEFTQVPTAAVLRPNTTNVSRQLLVLIRGSAFDENRINYDYSQIAAPAYGDGLIHRGYYKASEQLWGDETAGLQAVLKKLIVDATSGRVTSVLFAGHSMGGGLGTLLAARTEKYLAKECNSTTNPGACKFLPASLRAKPLVSLVGFAACNAGNPAFAADFNKRVNARLMDFAFDRVRKFLTAYNTTSDRGQHPPPLSTTLAWAALCCSLPMVCHSKALCGPPLAAQYQTSTPLHPKGRKRSKIGIMQSSTR